MVQAAGPESIRDDDPASLTGRLRSWKRSIDSAAPFGKVEAGLDGPVSAREQGRFFPL
jgi:hypothetical protein